MFSGGIDYTTSLIIASVDTLAIRCEYLTKRFFVEQCCLRICVSIICYQKKLILILWTNYAIQKHFNHSL